MGMPPAYPDRVQILPDGEFPPHWALCNDSHPINMARNGAYLSWSQGAGARPDCFDWTANDGVIARESNAANRQWGKYAAKITKATGDGGVSRLSINLETFGINSLMSEYYYTASLRIKTTRADFARVFYYDGAAYHYTDYHGGGGTWEELIISFEHTNGASDFVVGIEVAVPTGSSAFVYFDCLMITKGLVPTTFAENAMDRGLLCQEWDEDGSDHSIIGAARVIPFKVTGSTSGGPGGVELAASVVLRVGCRQIMHVSTNLYYFAALPQLHQVWANNYSTTGFDIYLGRTDGGNITGELNWIIDGACFAIGWDSPREQFQSTT